MRRLVVPAAVVVATVVVVLAFGKEAVGQAQRLLDVPAIRDTVILVGLCALSGLCARIEWHARGRPGR